MQRPGEVKLVKEVYLALGERLCIVGFAGADEALAVDPGAECEIGWILVRNEGMAVALIVGGEALVHFEPRVASRMAGDGIELCDECVKPVAEWAGRIAPGLDVSKAV